MPSRKQALLVFAKPPIPGTVKTRLTRLVTPEEAAELYRCFLLDALSAYAKLGVDVLLFVGPGDRNLMPDLPVTDLLEQRGESLGERLEHAFADAFGRGYEQAVVIGTDHPTLPLAHIEEAFRFISEGGVAIGPSEDGGYYLLGLSEPAPELFRNMQYSHAEVYCDTVRRLGMQHLAVLPSWYDVDEPDDLRRLSEDATLLPAEGATRAYVKALAERYDLVV
ncbi:MAG: TIGR04282 family arsenosugar biosynthesis glycosyltransferase [Bacteroidota bacterium]